MQVNIDTTQAIQQAEQFTKDISIPEILTREDFIISSNSMSLIKGRLKELDALRKSITKPLDEAKKNVMELFRPVQNKLTEYELQLRKRIMDYNTEQEKLRQIEEDRIRKEQEKEAERLRKRAEAAVKPETKERLEEEAAIIASTPAIVLPEKKVEGMHFMEIQKWEYVDDFEKKKKEYVLAILEKFPHLIIVDEPALTKLAKNLKGQVELKGINFYSTKVPVSK